MWQYLENIWKSKELRNRILISLLGILIFRLAANIPVPGININALRQVLDSNQFLGAFSILTGGSLSNFSIILMGVSPYINASIIMQLMTVVVPKLESMQKEEGEIGRQKISSYTRWLTLPLSFLQSYGMILLLNQMGRGVKIIEDTSFLNLLPMMLLITGGTIFLMWLGEVLTEKGISNGVSLIIFASIVSGIPTLLGQQFGFAQFDQSQIIPIAITIAISLILMAFIILVTEGQRNIPVAYAGRSTRGKSSHSHIPIRVNQAGMIPIIFAVSIVTFPQVMANFFINARTSWLRKIAEFVTGNFTQTSMWYGAALFIFVLLFTFFYVSITFQPTQVAENIQKRGGFIPGIRPGKNTIKFLASTSGHLSLWGGLFLGFVAVLPFIVNEIFRGFSMSSVPLLMSGAGMIIVVGVVLEVIRQINTSLIMHHYEKID